MDGTTHCLIWASERPVRLGGKWAFGCTVCAGAAQRSRASGATKKVACTSRLNSKWAKFKALPLQACDFAQHRLTNAHKLAVHMHSKPDEPITKAISETSLGDEFKGSVPQPPDWLNAWRSLREKNKQP